MPFNEVRFGELGTMIPFSIGCSKVLDTFCKSIDRLYASETQLSKSGAGIFCMLKVLIYIKVIFNKEV